MKPLAALFLSALALGSNAQILRDETFDSMASGNPNGVNGFFTSSTKWLIATSGVAGPPPPVSGTKVLHNSGTGSHVLGNTISSGWTNRTAGNNILRLSGHLYVRSANQPGRSITFGINSTTGFWLGYLGYTTSGNALYYGNDSAGIQTGPLGGRDVWHNFVVEIDTQSSRSYHWANGSYLGSTQYSGSHQVGAIGFVSVALDPNANFPNASFDSVRAEAISTGTVQVTLHLSALSGDHVPVGRTIRVLTIRDGSTIENQPVVVSSDRKLVFSTRGGESATFLLMPFTGTGSPLTFLSRRVVPSGFPRAGAYSQEVTLVNGDANLDDSVDLLDYFILSDSYNLGSTDAGYDISADFNRDNSVDLLDYFILSDGYNLVGDASI